MISFFSFSNTVLFLSLPLFAWLAFLLLSSSYGSISCSHFFFCPSDFFILFDFCWFESGSTWMTPKSYSSKYMTLSLKFPLYIFKIINLGTPTCASSHCFNSCFIKCKHLLPPVNHTVSYPYIAHTFTYYNSLCLKE